MTFSYNALYCTKVKVLLSTMQIGNVSHKDEGWYDCQVNTEPKVSSKVYLRIVRRGFFGPRGPTGHSGPLGPEVAAAAGGPTTTTASMVTAAASSVGIATF